MRHIFLALTNPVPGREADFNAWYDRFHLEEVVKYGVGMTGGRRYRLSDGQRPGQEPAPWSYLALYDMQHDDLAGYHAAPFVKDRPPLTPYTGLCAEDHVGWIYTPIGPRASRPGVGPGRASDDCFLFFALTNAAPGRDVEFNRWYDDFHLREVVETVPGFMAGQRYRLGSHQRQKQLQSPWTYLAVYEVQSASAASIHEAAAGVVGGLHPPGESLDPYHLAWVFEPVGRYIGSPPPSTSQDSVQAAP